MLRLADSPDLNILCLDTDPWLLLPEIEIGKESEELTVEIALRFSSELRALPDLLQFPALLDPEKVDAERTALQEAAANSRAKLEATTQRAKELEEQLGAAKLELEQRLNTAIADAIDARGDHRLATQHAEHLEQQVAKLREEATKVELEATQQVELEESLNAANSEIEKLKTEKLELEQKLDTALAGATDARDNHRLATQHAENLEQQLAKLRVEAATHEDTLAQAKVDFARFEQNKVELEDLLLIESTEATQAKKQLELVKQHSAVLEIQVANLRAELALKERSFAVAAEESARLTKSHTEIESRLKSEAEELQREVLRLAGEMAARESAIAALREAEASAQKLNRELTSELRTVRDSAAELARSARALESDLALSKDSNEEMLASLLAQNRAIHEVEHRAELLAAEHNRLVVESEDAARREAALTAELESARAALTELREHVEAINRRPLVRFDAALRRKFTPAQETGNDGIQQ